ncbi:Transposable element Tcb1 transposase [Anthophora quadrimaculata]
MIWPSQSPDLNPIELLWDELDREIRNHCPRSKQHLWELLQNNWKNIPIEILQQLVSRMPKLCKILIKKRGGYFDERDV